MLLSFIRIAVEVLVITPWPEMHVVLSLCFLDTLCATVFNVSYPLSSVVIITSQYLRKYSRNQLTLLVWCLEFAGNNVNCVQRLNFQYVVVDALTMIFFS